MGRIEEGGGERGGAGDIRGWLRVSPVAEFRESGHQGIEPGALVGQKKRRTWVISPARGGLRKGETHGRCTPSSPSERASRGSYEAAEVQGENQVKPAPRPEFSHYNFIVISYHVAIHQERGRRSDCPAIRGFDMPADHAATVA